MNIQILASPSPSSIVRRPTRAQAWGPADARERPLVSQSLSEWSLPLKGERSRERTVERGREPSRERENELVFNPH